MTSILQIAPEILQTVLNDKINDAFFQATHLVSTQIYDQALKTYHQILNYVALLSKREQQSYFISYLISYYEIGNVLQPLTQLSRQEQDKWIEWLKKVQQYVLNLSEHPIEIAQNLKQLARVYQKLGRTELVAIAMQQATAEALQIPDPTSRIEQLIQLASIWVEFQQKAEAQKLLTQAIATVEQIPTEETFAWGNSLVSIALLYIQMSEARRALALADKIAHQNSPDTILQEIVRDAIKREDLHLAQVATAKIQTVQYQADALVEMAIYWATHHRVRLGNRLFAQALKRVAQEESAQHLQLRLIQTYSTSGQLTIVLNAVQRLTYNELKAQALSAMAVTYAKLNQPQQVQKIIAQLKGLINWEAILLSTAIYTEQYNLVITVFNAVKHNSDLVYKSGWYRELVQVLLRSQAIDEALQLAKQAPNDVSPDEQSSNLHAIALAYANAQQWSQAIEVVTQIQNTTSTPYQVLTRIELAAIAPTPAEFTSVIQPAIAQAQAFEGIEPKASALAAIAIAYLRSGNEAQAQSFLQQTIQTMQQVEDDESQSRGRLFAQIIDYLIIQNQYTAALTIAQAYLASDLRDNVYNAVLYQLSLNKAVDVALAVVEVELLPDRQATTLLEIARMYALQQRQEDAITYLDRAFVVAQQIADPESRTIIRYESAPEPDYNDRRSQYTRLVKQYVALQQLDKAQQVVEKVQETSLRDYLQAWIDC